MLVKGVCQAAMSFQQVDPDIAERQMDLVRAALAPPAGGQTLRGRTPTIADMERAHVALAARGPGAQRMAASSATATNSSARYSSE